MLLYNNMLQSLFRSQILTIGVVFLAIMLMFMTLFRSVSIAVLGIIYAAPNLYGEDPAVQVSRENSAGADEATQAAVAVVWQVVQL